MVKNWRSPLIPSVMVWSPVMVSVVHPHYFPSPRDTPFKSPKWRGYLYPSQPLRLVMVGWNHQFWSRFLDDWSHVSVPPWCRGHRNWSLIPNVSPFEECHTVVFQILTISLIDRPWVKSFHVYPLDHVPYWSPMGEIFNFHRCFYPLASLRLP